MSWYVYFAFFFGGVFFANVLPHLIAGVSGRSFPTPFASPPFRGLSSPTVNVAWALVNLAVAYVLLARVGAYDLRDLSAAGASFAGFGLMAIQLARSVGRLHNNGQIFDATV